jgi:hypothetical protein
MALGFNFGGGGGSADDIVPIVKFDCRSGRMFRIDRANGENHQTDLTRSFKAIFDFENVETGWIAFTAGTAPSFNVVKYGSPVPAQPSADHKPGVRLLVKLSKDAGGDVRELASTAKAFLRGLDDLHTAYEAGVVENPGKLPVVELADTVAITTGEGARKSTNYAPVFKIVSWVARPADFVWRPKAQSAAPVPAPLSAPPSTGSVRATAPAALSDDDFG